MSQQVYTAYKNKDGRTRWIKNHSLYFKGESTALLFTPATCSVGFLTGGFPSGMDIERLTVMAQDKLDQLHIGWSDMKSPRFAYRRWDDTISEVCLIDFSLLGPLPFEIGAQCDGERVEMPKGEMVCYGG